MFLQLPNGLLASGIQLAFQHSHTNSISYGFNDDGDDYGLTMECAEYVSDGDFTVRFRTMLRYQS